MSSNNEDYENFAPLESAALATALGTGDENNPAGAGIKQVTNNELIDSFLDSYPEFGDLPQNVIAQEFAQSDLLLSRGAWGKWFHMAQGLWCAHNLALQWDIAESCAKLGKKNPYDVSAVTSQTASTTSLSLSTTPSDMLKGDDPLLLDFARTSYGMRYLNLLYTIIPAGEVVCSPDARGG